MPNRSQATSSVDATLAQRAFGAMILTFFGTMWLEIWDWRAGAGPAAFAAIALSALGLLAVGYRRYRRFAPALAAVPETPEKRRTGRVFNVVNAGQWIVIVVLGNVLANTGYGAWVVPMAIAVVGLHFVPLAVVFRNRAHYALAIAMVGFALIYPRWAPGGPADPVGFLGAGALLWASVLWALRPAAADRA